MALDIKHATQTSELGSGEKIGDTEWDASHTLTGTLDTANIADGAVTTAKLNDGSVTSAKIADGTIVNADINASAAIALSKLATDPLARANHTGTQSADTLTDGTTNKAYTATEKTKLAGIATGATANSSDATLLARANHTGEQAISTVTGLQAAIDGKAATSHTHTISDTTGLQTAIDGKAASSHTHPASDITNFNEAVDDRVANLLLAGSNVTVNYDDTANTFTINSTGEGGATDHGALTGLSDDDHTQYHTDARGDARYYTQTQVDTALSGKAASSHNHAAGDITSGTLAVARLGSGSVTDKSVLRGNATWSVDRIGAIRTNPAYYLPDGDTLATATTAEKTAAFQAAIAAMQSVNGIVEFAGKWDVDDTLATITAPIKIEGSTVMGAQIIYHGTSGAVFEVTFASPIDGAADQVENNKNVVFKDFTILLYDYATVTPDSTCVGIKITDTAAYSAYSDFANMIIKGFYVCVDMIDVTQYLFLNCHFYDYRLAGTRQQATYNPDAGDMHFLNCFWWSDPAMPGRQTRPSAHVHHSSAGLTITNPKMWGNAGEDDCGLNIYLNNASGAAVNGQIRVLGGSIEDHDYAEGGAAIRFDSLWGRGGTGTSVAANRCVTLEVKNVFAAAGYLVDVQSLAGALGVLHIVGCTAFRGSAIRISNCNRLLVASNYLDAETFIDDATPNGPSKWLEVTGTVAGYRIIANTAFAFPGGSDLPETINAAAIVATGSRTSTTYLAGDNTWSTPAGGGDDFTLTTPADLAFRYRFSDNTDANNAEISTHADISGNSLDISQATSARRPIIKDVTNGAASFRAAEFDGTQNLARASVTGTAFTGTNAFDVWYVIKMAAGNFNNALMSWRPTDDTNHTAHWGGGQGTASSGGSAFIHGDETGGGGAISEAPTGAEFATGEWLVIRMRRSTTSGEVFVDGASAYSGTFSDALDNTATATLMFGDFSGDPNNGLGFGGQIAEIIGCKAAQDTDSRDSIHAYLEATYGVTIA